MSFNSLEAAYSSIVTEAADKKGMTVKKTATGKGQTAGLVPGDLPADTKSAQEIQPGTGTDSKSVKGIKNPVKHETNVKSGKIETMKTEAKKSFIEMYNEVMVNEVAPDIGGPEFDQDKGDFPKADGEEGMDADMPTEEIPGESAEGDTFGQLADLFAQISDIFRTMTEEGGATEDQVGMDEPAGDMPPEGAPVGEAVSQPEPKEFNPSISGFQAPRKLAGKGVQTAPSSKASVKGNDKQKTGELEDAPKGEKKSMKVDGSGAAHKAGASAFESR